MNEPATSAAPEKPEQDTPVQDAAQDAGVQESDVAEGVTEAREPYERVEAERNANRAQLEEMTKLVQRMAQGQRTPEAPKVPAYQKALEGMTPESRDMLAPVFSHFESRIAEMEKGFRTTQDLSMDTAVKHEFEAAHQKFKLEGYTDQQLANARKSVQKMLNDGVQLPSFDAAYKIALYDIDRQAARDNAASLYKAKQDKLQGKTGALPKSRTPSVTVPKMPAEIANHPDPTAALQWLRENVK
jgi:hypothetical protein